MTQEEQEIRAVQQDLWVKTFLVVLQDTLTKEAQPYEDKCYDAAYMASEAVTLFNGYFSGRGIGPTVKEHREAVRRTWKYNSVYDRAMKEKE